MMWKFIIKCFVHCDSLLGTNMSAVDMLYQVVEEAEQERATHRAIRRELATLNPVELTGLFHDELSLYLDSMLDGQPGVVYAELLRRELNVVLDLDDIFRYHSLDMLREFENYNTLYVIWWHAAYNFPYRLSVEDLQIP